MYIPQSCRMQELPPGGRRNRGSPCRLAALQEGKTELPEKGGWKSRRICHFKQCLHRHPVDTVQDLAPGIKVLLKEMDPVIQGGDRNIPVHAEIRHRNCPVQILLQDCKNKAERVGTERDQDVRKNCVGMAAGSAQKPWNRERYLLPLSAGDVDQITLIGMNLLELAQSLTQRTAMRKWIKRFNCQIKELPVRKR